jgi:hypothetical protein
VPLYLNAFVLTLLLSLIGGVEATDPHQCALTYVPLNVDAAELGPGAPEGVPAQQGVGEAEAEAAVPGAPAEVPAQQGVDSPSDDNEEVCCMCPSLHFPHF